MIPETHHILRTYLRRLTNLGGNNRSLLLLRLHQEQLLDLHQLSFLNNEPSFEIVKSLVAGKDKKLCALLDSRLEAVNQVSAKLKRLQRLDKFIFDERGANDLHVGWPMVHGKFSDGTPVRCALLYFPVQLVEDNNHWVLRPRQDAGITFNKSFLLAYSFYNQVTLHDDLPETTFDDFDPDSTVFRTQLYQLLKDSIELNFNPDTFTDQLTAFTEFSKEDFVEAHKPGELKLHREAVLGIFPQAGSQLVPDYLKLMESHAFTDLEDFFSQRVQGSSSSLQQWVSAVKEDKIYTPFSQDAYQEHTLRVVKNGSSVVVQGPPGTGKSQVIANLVADGIASGKKILVVCQKRVALDVVFERLEKIGLADFLGLVHDFRNDRKSIYDKIARQVDRVEDFKNQDRSLDAIQLERRFLQVSHAIDQQVDTLEEFRKALFDETECGLSAKELYLTSDPHAAQVDLRQQYQHLNFSSVHDFSAKLKLYARYAATFEQPGYPWKNRKSFAGYGLPALKNIEQVVSGIVAFQTQLEEDSKSLLNVSLTLEQGEALLGQQQTIDEVLGLLDSEGKYGYFRRLIAEGDDRITAGWLEEMEQSCVSCFDEAGIENTLNMQLLMTANAALHERMEARRGLVKLFRWKFFAKNRFLLKRVMSANNLRLNKQGFETLEQRIDNRLNLEHQLAVLRERKSFTDVPVVDGNVAKLKTWFARQEKALRAKNLFQSVREFRKVINVDKLTHSQFRELLVAVFKRLNTIPGQRMAWEEYLTPFQVRVLMAKPGQADTFIKTLRTDFDNLVAFDTLRESLLPHEKEIINKLFDSVAGWDVAQLEPLFQNSIRLAWIDHLEMKHPVLRMPSSLGMQELEIALRKHIDEKQALSNEILKMRARERVYGSIEYNRLNNRVTYRDLYHQATKKRKIWPVRKVVTEFSNELFNIIPCWLASPEAVSAIFPMEQLFDLVIFDEASQCFAERGIPAMYRGRQVVIAGDDKQLKPFELYQVRWTEDDVQAPDLEVTSLLELSGRYLPTVHLQGHYRSQSLPLIEFSNKYFYQGRLKLLPDKKVLNSQETPITFRKIAGEWFNQTNLVEALAVVDFVLFMVQQFPKKAIGVITFNAPQQVMIMDLLEEKALREHVVLPASLFVKNIENVQGDERDVIIFSVGYAPDAKGKLSMQFGSLNVAGGENRLNVAITRARERIVIFSSIEPGDLTLQGIKNEGPKLLKKYLEFAREVSEDRFEGHAYPAPVHATTWYLNQSVLEQARQRYPGHTFLADALPFADVVVGTGTTLAGVMLTDDHAYQSSLTVKEAHAYTPALLEQKHWPQWRVFSRSWWSNRPQTEAELAKFIYHLTEGE